MEDSGARIRLSIEVAIAPKAAFFSLIEELTEGLAALGMRFEGGPRGRVFEGALEVGSVTAWEPPARMELEWASAAGAATRVELSLEAIETVTRVTFEHHGRGAFAEATELLGWFARENAAPFLQSTTPGVAGDWFTDRLARRPSGSRARAMYRDPVYHYAGFRAILAELALTRNDILVDVGCGGGAFLAQALESGCHGAGVDHSKDMVRVCRELNQEAVAAGRLQIVEAPATSLPFPDHSFTCASMHGVLGFLASPVAALREIHRILRPRGRAIVLGSDPELKGTPACPEPIASRVNFYDDQDLLGLASEAGFRYVNVIRRNLAADARIAGVPEEHLSLFDPGSPRFLVARKG